MAHAPAALVRILYMIHWAVPSSQQNAATRFRWTTSLRQSKDLGQAKSCLNAKDPKNQFEQIVVYVIDVIDVVI